MQVIKNREKNILMDIYNFLIISLIFVILFLISKKLDFLKDDISFSNHKIIGAEKQITINNRWNIFCNNIFIF